MGLTLKGLVDSLGLVPDQVAVEHNLKIVRRGNWPDTVLASGDRVEIVHFVGGGTQV